MEKPKTWQGDCKGLTALFSLLYSSDRVIILHCKQNGKRMSSKGRYHLEKKRVLLFSRGLFVYDYALWLHGSARGTRWDGT